MHRGARRGGRDGYRFGARLRRPSPLGKSAGNATCAHQGRGAREYGTERHCLVLTPDVEAPLRATSQAHNTPHPLTSPRESYVTPKPVAPLRPRGEQHILGLEVSVADAGLVALGEGMQQLVRNPPVHHEKCGCGRGYSA